MHRTPTTADPTPSGAPDRGPGPGDGAAAADHPAHVEEPMTTTDSIVTPATEAPAAPSDVTITGLLWRLRRIYPKDGHWGLTGIHLDGEYAVATDGSCLVAHPMPSDGWPATWRIRIHFPFQMPDGAAGLLPIRLGVHAVQMATGKKTASRPALLEVVEDGTFPNWRSAMPSDHDIRTKAATFNPGLLQRVSGAMPIRDRYTAMEMFPDFDSEHKLGAAIMRHGGSIAIIMPMRGDR